MFGYVRTASSGCQRLYYAIYSAVPQNALNLTMDAVTDDPPELKTVLTSLSVKEEPNDTSVAASLTTGIISIHHC